MIRTVGRLVLQVNWAKEGLWHYTGANGGRHQYVVAFYRTAAPEGDVHCYNLVLGRLALGFGVRKP